MATFSTNQTISRTTRVDNTASINRKHTLPARTLRASSPRAPKLIISSSFLQPDFWTDLTNSTKIEYECNSKANHLIMIANIVEYINVAIIPINYNIMSLFSVTTTNEPKCFIRLLNYLNKLNNTRAHHRPIWILWTILTININNFE